MIHVVHVITGLGQGGAEAVLYRLIAASRHGCKQAVISLTGSGIYGEKLRALGVRVETLDMPNGRVTFSGLLRLFRLLTSMRPAAVQTWMYHADLVGGVMARLAGCRRVVWGIRNSNLEAGKVSLSSRLAARLCALLSGWVPSAIACCSFQAAEAHQRLGYAAGKFVVIPNGYDLERLKPDPAARQALRREWGVGGDTPLIGFVARWDPLKDHATLLRAIARLARQGVDFRCVLVGAGMDVSSRRLADLIGQEGVGDRVILAGPRNDIAAVMNALDVHTLSSYGEAFPNVLAEAMACGTPCVTTDVGDAARIVGETGWVVPPADPDALAQAIAAALAAVADEDSRHEIAARCRRRIEDNYSLQRMVDAFLAVWNGLTEVTGGFSKGGI